MSRLLKEKKNLIPRTFTPKIDEQRFVVKNDKKFYGKTIDISSDYAHVNPNDPDYFYIPIFFTSDIHGHFYPKDVKSGKTTYTKGGLDYIAKYLSILRKEFGDRVLYLDGGDEFQGGVEAEMKDSALITKYLDIMGCNAATFGNHEFDYDRSFISQRVNEANFSYVDANLYDNYKKSKKLYDKNNDASKIFKITAKDGTEIKIGVIGLVTILEKTDINGKGYENVTFLAYRDELIKESQKLRKKDKVDAVLLLSHLDLECGDESYRMELNMYTRKTKQKGCSKDMELYILLNSINNTIVDAVLSGHSHFEAHHWINGIPVVSVVNAATYANILYLPFKKINNNKYKLFRNEIKIEGPLPACEKIFGKLRACPILTEDEIEEFLPLVEYKFHGVLMEKEPKLNKLHEEYDEEYNKYMEVLCEFIGPKDGVVKCSTGDCILVNLISDVLKNRTASDIAIMNTGSIKTAVYPGEIRGVDIVNLVPYENYICSYKLTGEEIIKIISTIQVGKKAYYGVSGIKQIMSIKKDKSKSLKSVVLFDGKNEAEIIPDKVYKVSSVDYLINGGDDFKSIINEINPQEKNCDYGVIADVVTDYLRDAKIVDSKNHYDTNNPRLKEIQE